MDFDHAALIRRIDEMHEERKLLLANLEREKREVARLRKLIDHNIVNDAVLGECRKGRERLRDQLKHVLPQVWLKDGREGLSFGQGPEGHDKVRLIWIEDEASAGYLFLTEMRCDRCGEDHPTECCKAGPGNCPKCGKLAIPPPGIHTCVPK